MAEAVVKKVVCEMCGVDLRFEALFCYNCGESIAIGEDPETKANKQPPSGNGRVVEEKVFQPTVASIDIDKPVKAEVVSDDESVEEKAELRMAAAIRNRTKSFNRKPVEIEWVERNGASPVFIIGSIVLVLFALILLAFASYLK